TSPRSARASAFKGRRGRSTRWLRPDRFREHLDQLGVGGRKAQLPELVPRHPPHLLTHQRPWFALEGAPVKVQLHGPVVVGVDSGVQRLANSDVDVELLFELSPERIGVWFVRVDLAAGKLPQPREVDARLPPRDQETVVGLDNRGDDDDHAREGTDFSAMRTRSASWVGVKGFCRSGTPPQKLPCTAVASSV